MSGTAVEKLRVRSPRLDRDEFELTPVGRRAGKGGGTRNARRNCDRTTVEDEPTESPGTPSTLDAFDGGEADD